MASVPYSSCIKGFGKRPSTIDLGHNLGLNVIAEGVENDVILARLAELGCDIAQGYLIGKPMPAAMLQEWESAYRSHGPH